MQIAWKAFLFKAFDLVGGKLPKEGSVDLARPHGDISAIRSKLKLCLRPETKTEKPPPVLEVPEWENR